MYLRSWQPEIWRMWWKTIDPDIRTSELNVRKRMFRKSLVRLND
jgi:hypothetical protein